MRVQVQGRLTFSGEQCRLPMVYQGQLLTDCLATAVGDQCFPVGSGESLRNCSAAKKTSHTLAAILLAGSTIVLDGESFGLQAATLHAGYMHGCQMTLYAR